LIEHQIASGIHGLFVLGTAGEGLLLGPDERRAAAEFALEKVGGRVPLAVHCGAPDTHTAAALAAHASEGGADAVAVVSPFYFAYGPAALRQHFTDVAHACSAPVYLYDNPERVGYSLDFEMVHELVREVENIRGVKDTGDSVARVTRYGTFTDPPVEVYTGNNLIVLPALLMGALGSVSALASAFPELFVALYELWKKGEVDQATRVQLTAARLQAVLDGVPYVGGIKYLMHRRGLPSGGMRAPLPAVGGSAALIEARLEVLDESVTRWSDGAK
jgi:4-hydroxy-tetrahydrodipicolinate synthase